MVLDWPGRSLSRRRAMRDAMAVGFPIDVKVDRLPLADTPAVWRRAVMGNLMG